MAGHPGSLHGRGGSSELAAQRQERNILGQEENILGAMARGGWEKKRTEEQTGCHAAGRGNKVGRQHGNGRETFKKLSGELYVVETSQCVR